MIGERMSWWRAHHGLPSHPKWLQAARKSGQAVPVVFSVAMWMLDAASKAEPRGSVASFDVGACAAYLWIDDDAVLAVIGALEVIAWIEDGSIKSWAERQPAREDPTAAERKRLQREREAAARASQQAIDIADTGTPAADPAHHVTNSHAPEKRREDTDSESIEPSLRSGSSPATRDDLLTSLVDLPDEPDRKSKSRKGRKSGVKTRIFEDTQPTEKDCLAATSAGMDKEEFRIEWRKFRNYHLAEGSLKSNWAGAWGYWIGNWEQRRPRGRARGVPFERPIDGITAILQSTDLYKSRQEDNDHEYGSSNLIEYRSN